jgi:predicted PilT family ATPase
MDDFDVNISVPSSDRQSDVIVVTGTKNNVEDAIEALAKKNAEIESENQDRELRRFELVIEVPAEHHTKIIGRKGQVINKLRDDYQVNIQVPQADTQSNEIRLIGYEANCQRAADAILGMIKELEDQTTIEVMIDQRIHSRIIGQKGRSVRKVMDMFKVDIRFPRGDSPDLVLISGGEDACEECKEHLLMLEEEYMEDVRERQEERDMMSSYMRDRSGGRGNQDSNQAKEYIVKDAPWAQTEADFPSLGGAAPAKSAGKAWGSWGQ